MSQDLFGSLFNSGGLKLNENVVNGQAGNANEFRPSYLKGQNGRYEAVIRFIPNPRDAKEKSIIHKWVVFLKNPLTNSGRNIDSPTSVGEQDPMSQMFFQLRNSANPQAKAVADDFKRHERFYSLIQVIDCPSEPALVNKILVWPYGMKIAAKLNEEMTSMMAGVEPGMPFDLFKNRLFKVVADKNGDFNNLDSCRFFDAPAPNNYMRMVINRTNPATGAVEPQLTYATPDLAGTEEGKKLIAKYLMDNAPDMSEYEYKPWDEATKKYVDEMILLHGQILSGQAVTPQQANAAVGNMTATQAQPYSAPQVGQAQSAVATPSLSSILNQPIPNANPTIPTNTVPQSVSPTTQSDVEIGTSNPLSGLNVGMSAPVANPTNAGTINQNPQIGGITGIDTTSIDSIMNSSAQPAPANPAAPATGIGDISSILKDTVV